MTASSPGPAGSPAADGREAAASTMRGARAHRLARLPSGRRTKYLVLAFWIVVIALTGSLAGKLQGAEKNDASAYLPPSAESTQELNAQSAFVPKNLNPAVVVYQRTSGITAADMRKAAADARDFAALPAVGGRVSGPLESADHKAIETVIGARLGYSSNISGFVAGLRATASRGDPGLKAFVAGPVASAADEVKIFNGIDSTLLYATLAVVITLLLLTYRSPVLWLLPIMSAGVALTAAEAVIYLLTRHGLTVNGQSGGILVVLVLGASTDYALLLIARYREELRRHADRHEAMAIALRRAGPAILASAATVIAGMLCLLAAESADISGLGPVAAIGIAVGLLAMITLLPALLVICGRWVFWPARPRFGSAEPTTRGLWARIGRMIAVRPRVVWAVTAIALACASLGLIGFKIGTLSSAQSFRGTPPSVTAEQVLARHFPGGAGEPVAVTGKASAAAAMGRALSATPGIASVTPPQVRGDLAYLQGTLTSKPDSPAAYATIDAARSRLHAVAGADAKVGGGTAINLDVERYATRDRNLIIPLVLLVVLIILGLLLRSVVAPLVLIGTVILSFGAALGLSALAFRNFFGFAGADTSMPLFVFVFLVALGIDYNIFLMTRVREESARAGTRRGALTGLAATGGVITSAGAVLAGTFAMLGTLPLVIFTEIGFAVAFGVLLDTIIVRSVLVTALTLDLDRWMWWPSQLCRVQRGPMLAHAESQAAIRRLFSRHRAVAPMPSSSTPRQIGASTSAPATRLATSPGRRGGRVCSPAPSTHTRTTVPAGVPGGTWAHPVLARPPGPVQLTGSHSEPQLPWYMPGDLSGAARISTAGCCRHPRCAASWRALTACAQFPAAIAATGAMARNSAARTATRTASRRSIRRRSGLRSGTSRRAFRSVRSIASRAVHATQRPARAIHRARALTGRARSTSDTPAPRHCRMSPAPRAANQAARTGPVTVAPGCGRQPRACDGAAMRP